MIITGEVQEKKDIKGKELKCYLADKKQIFENERIDYFNPYIVPYKSGRTQIIELEENKRSIVYVVFVGELENKINEEIRSIPDIVNVEIVQEDAKDH